MVINKHVLELLAVWWIGLAGGIAVVTTYTYKTSIGAMVLNGNCFLFFVYDNRDADDGDGRYLWYL